MDLGDKDKFSSEKGTDDHLNYHSSSMSPSWQFGAANLTDQPMGLFPINNLVANCGDTIVSSNSSSISMVDSFCSNLWGNPNSQNLGLTGSSIHAGTSVGKGVLGSSGAGSDKALDLDWSLRNSMPKEGVFLPQTLSQFPADPAFIERAARFSCFTGGSFSDMVNPFSISECMNHRFKGGKTSQGSPEVVMDDGLNLKPTSRSHSPMNDTNMTPTTKYVPVHLECGATEGSPIGRMESIVRPPDEEKQETGASSNESYDAEVSGSGGQGERSVLENASGEPSSSKGVGMKKRKRSGQDTEINKAETAKDSNETKQKTDQNATSIAKASKHSKDSSRNSDAPKEDYIHVRARRGQATNSHSLAERVRREKISERMKFLQDLVPGCSKVTGKAVMLDEIINYVQSLQRQVEFLSMKLAAVNPRLDLNTEGLLAKDVREVLQSRGGLSTFPFSADTRMVHPQLHPSQQELIQPRMPATENPSDALRRINSQLMAMNGGYKGSAQIPNMWDDELNNVLQMNFGANSSFNGQDTNDSQPLDHMKDEL